jgi:hypothetical protein
VVVRFYSGSADPARLSIRNLEGELVASATVPAIAGAMNEHRWELPGLASGIYLVLADVATATGRARWQAPLAVER